MTRDFANSKRKPARRKVSNASSRSTPIPGSPPWLWFVSGVLCGVFLSGLLWLAFQTPNTPAAGKPATSIGERTASEQSPRPRFDFYTLLPEQKIDVNMEPDPIARGSSEDSTEQFLLQAGSFRQEQDADRRRAELLLLGLAAHVEEASGDTGRWFRVYIGPFQSRSKLAKARSLTAQQGIDTLLLKRPRQGRG